MTEATTLLQALAGGPLRPHPRCKLGRIIDALDDQETRGSLTRALLDGGWSSRLIAQLVTRHVEPIGHDAVAAHRSGACGCNR